MITSDLRGADERGLPHLGPPPQFDLVIVDEAHCLHAPAIVHIRKNAIS